MKNLLTFAIAASLSLPAFSFELKAPSLKLTDQGVSVEKGHVPTKEELKAGVEAQAQAQLDAAQAKVESKVDDQTSPVTDKVDQINGKIAEGQNKVNDKLNKAQSTLNSFKLGQ